jgi:hypothetical protein
MTDEAIAWDRAERGAKLDRRLGIQTAARPRRRLSCTARHPREQLTGARWREYRSRSIRRLTSVVGAVAVLGVPAAARAAGAPPAFSPGRWSGTMRIEGGRLSASRYNLTDLAAAAQAALDAPGP